VASPLAWTTNMRLPPFCSMLWNFTNFTKGRATEARPQRRSGKSYKNGARNGRDELWDLDFCPSFSFVEWYERTSGIEFIPERRRRHDGDATREMSALAISNESTSAQRGCCKCSTNTKAAGNESLHHCMTRVASVRK
jgi:hypothetical protein